MTGIKALADHLGISIGTVSRALNNKPDVKKATRARVLAAAAELGYAPNQSGRNLRKGKTNAVGFMFEAGDPGAHGGDNFFLSVVASAQSVFKARNIDLVMLPCGPDETPVDYLKRMVARRFVDGIILTATTRDDPRISYLERTGIPFVALGRSTSGTRYRWIDLDFEGAAREGVRLLARHGHRRLAVAIPESDANLGYVFRDAFLDALVENGLDPQPDLVFRVESSEQGGLDLSEQLLARDPRPTAVLLSYELMAIGLYHGLQNAGLKPGDDLAIVSLRESPQIRFLSPALPSFRLDLHGLGAELAQALLDEMQNRDVPRKTSQGMLWPFEALPKLT
ncbi:LacI family DNA-binding transcriptional regulator [Qingshengfaniella alkalisoli]|uniref:LacI family transcriptional regulator n=1 Tax=Qingshengfaniella alkalisoli TaxID=2599296 RepID=A0A5B8J1R5_9RHOB|nr:LacI family DNA-binding transcriptional regulator [Qingshengfaniella alkalisoli]QDY70758.1 LacI family transcriptional regulator [Qingshengfaniella alkalisoli]